MAKKNRFEVIENTMDDDHPYLAGQKLYQVKDREKRITRFGAYVKKSRASEVCKQLNEKYQVRS